MDLSKLVCGDNIHVRVQFSRFGERNCEGLVLVTTDRSAFWVKRDNIVHVEPRPMEAGDEIVVTAGTLAGYSGKILAVDGGVAWCKLSMLGKAIPHQTVPCRLLERKK